MQKLKLKYRENFKWEIYRIKETIPKLDVPRMVNSK